TMLCKNATLNLDNFGQATLTVAQINNGSFDNCGIPFFALSQSFFTCANLGANSVKLTGTDPSGNSGQCTATVTVVDLIPPVAKCKNAIVNLGTNGTVTVAASTVNNGSSDNCSFTLTLTPATFSCANLGNNTVTLKATDGSGNMHTCTAILTVKDVTPPTMLCKNLTIFLDNQGQVTLLASQVDNGSTDNCGIVSRSINLTQFNCSDINSTKNVFLTGTDGSGNSANCLSLVTVKDNLPPTAICRDTLVHLGPNGTVTVSCAVLANNSYDNCSVWSFLPVAKVYTAANIGTNNLSILVKDFSGNGTTCISVVTVSSTTNNSFFENDPNTISALQTATGSAGGAAQTLPQARAEVPDFHLVIYPNPTAGEATMAFELPVEQEFHLVVYDLLGRVVLRQAGMGLRGLNHCPLALGEAGAGLYLLELQAGKGRIWGKVTVEK
ncbi:MAG: T9SS type A sorting domain-containing protein, partial [Saprospiraceae bacterium]